MIVAIAKNPLEVKITGEGKEVFRREHTKTHPDPTRLHPLNCKVNQVSARRNQMSAVMVKLISVGASRGIHTGASDRLVKMGLWNGSLDSKGRLSTNLSCELIN